MYDEVPGEYWGYEPNPHLELILVFAVVAAAVLAWAITYAVMRKTEKGRREDAIRHTYLAIRHRAWGASAAVGHDVLGKAQALVAEIEKRLGPVAGFGSELGGKLGDVKKALKGEPPKPAPAPPPAAKPEPAKGEAKVGEAASPAAHAHAHVSILTHGPIVLSGAPAEKKPEPAAPAPLEHAETVRLAVAKFADWWITHEAQRMKDLRDAQAALLKVDPLFEIQKKH